MVAKETAPPLISKGTAPTSEMLSNWPVKLVLLSSSLLLLQPQLHVNGCQETRDTLFDSLEGAQAGSTSLVSQKLQELKGSLSWCLPSSWACASRTFPTRVYPSFCFNFLRNKGLVI